MLVLGDIFTLNEFIMNEYMCRACMACYNFVNINNWFFARKVSKFAGTNEIQIHRLRIIGEAVIFKQKKRKLKFF